MKKRISILLVLAMLFTLAACSSKQETKEPETKEPETLGEFLNVAFRKAAGEASNMEELANTLLSDEKINFGGMAMTVEPGLLNGFDNNEIKGFTDGAVFAPMIGSIPFIGYVFQVEKGVNVNDFMQSLKDSANLRWNICTEADEMVVDAVDQTVFFVMCPTSLEE